MVNKNLSLNTLKGLLNDIVHNTANPGVFFFEGYKILITKKGIISTNDDKLLKKRIDNRHKYYKNAYHKKKNDNRCVKCGSKDLHIKDDGEIGVRCKACQKLQTEQQQHRRKGNNINSKHWHDINSKDTNSKNINSKNRHYLRAKEKGICVECGSDDLYIRQNGSKGVRCKKCQKLNFVRQDRLRRRK